MVHAQKYNFEAQSRILHMKSQGTFKISLRSRPFRSTGEPIFIEYLLVINDACTVLHQYQYPISNFTL